MKNYLFYHFQIPVTFDCNLKCCNCQFNCDKWTKNQHSYIPLNKFKEYVLQIKRIQSSSNVPVSLTIFGGEPLLHPDVIEMLKFVKDNLYELDRVNFSTNGIKLLSMSDEFYSLIRDMKAWIVVSKYPININYDKIFKFVKSKNCKIINTAVNNGIVTNDCWNDYIVGDTITKFGVCRITKSKVRSPHYCANFLCCPIYKNKIFPCSLLLTEYRLREFNISNNKNDIPCLELDKVQNFEQIIDFIDNDNNMKICEHCFWKRVKWKTNKKLLTL